MSWKKQFWPFLERAFKSQELNLALPFELYHGMFLGWLDTDGIFFCTNMRNKRKNSVSALNTWVRFLPRLILTKTNPEQHMQVLGNVMFWKVL